MNNILEFYSEHGRNLLNENKLFKWEFKYSNRYKTLLGLCNFSTKEIILNQTFAKNAKFEDVHDIILHEIAHALVGYEHQHNTVWKNKFIKLGGSGNVFYSFGNNYVPYSYESNCCSRLVGRYSKPRTNLYCANCSKKLIFKKTK